MGVFSRHAKVLEDEQRAMSVKTALAVINRVWEEIENELDQAFDPETQVALAWYATYGFDARPSGELITLTTAKNTSDRALFDSGVFKDMKGKGTDSPRGVAPGWSPAGDKTLTTWECVQHTARVLNAANGGGEAAAALVAQMGPKADEARALASSLFEIATNKGWAAEALVYNELAQEWSKLEDRAATLGDAGLARAQPDHLRFRWECVMSTEDVTARRVEDALKALRRGLAPFVEARMKGKHGDDWRKLASRASGGDQSGPLDTYGLLKTIVDNWRFTFDEAFGQRDRFKVRNFVSTALDARNATAHLTLRYRTRRRCGISTRSTRFCSR